MQPVSVILGSHCHVPDGLAEAEYETAYDERLKPFLSALYRYPKIPAVLHYSGPLLYWVERRKAEFFDLIREMLKRKQIEILSGGFYEPAMHLLAPQDRMGQVEMLSTYIRKHFGKRSAGAWISGECWEQSVVTPLANCAISYTFLPERFFSAAGVKAADLGQPVYTENQGALVTVFPVLPFGAAQNRAHVAAQYAARNVAGGYGGDQKGNEGHEPPLTVAGLSALIGERGGNGVYTVFPERFSGNGRDAQEDICAFLESSLAPETGINWTIPARLWEEDSGGRQLALKSVKRLKRLYFPCGEAKGFLTECAEANLLYAKMVYTSDLVRQLRGDRERKKTALHEVYKAQCHNLYTASSRHNITDPALRQAAYRALLSAERMARETKKTVSALYRFDFDFDGSREDIFRGNDLCFYAHRRGGHIFGIDYLPACWNYIDSFNHRSFVETLYPETSAGIRTGSGDAVRAALDAIDHRCVRRCGGEWWEEAGSDRAKQKLALTLPHAPPGVAFEHIGIEKTYRLHKDTLVVCWTLHNQGTADERLLFCPELHLAFAGNGDGRLRIFAIKDNERARIATDGGHDHSTGIDGYQFEDLYNETVVSLSSGIPFDAILGANTMFGRYQSHSLTVIIPLVLHPGAKIAREFTLTVAR